MGARLLVIEFEDEASALKLKEQLDERTKAGRPLRVVGLFAVPRNVCQCDPSLKTTGRTGESIMRRGRKFGWWVCSVCKRPDASGSGLRNLLRPRDILRPVTWSAPDWRNKVRQWRHYIPSLSLLPVTTDNTSWDDE